MLHYPLCLLCQHKMIRVSLTHIHVYISKTLTLQRSFCGNLGEKTLSLSLFNMACKSIPFGSNFIFLRCYILILLQVLDGIRSHGQVFNWKKGRLISVWNIPTDRWTVTTGKIQGEDRRFIQISVKSKSSLQLLHSTLKLLNHPVKCSVYMYLANSYLYPP